MTQYFEGFRYDITTAAASSGTDTRLVPKAGTLALYRKGATITAGTGGGPGNVAMTISDPGTIIPGDTVQIGNGAVTGTVQVGGYTSTSITVNWPSAVTWDTTTNNRLIVNTVGSRPTAYSDPYMGTSLGTSVSFGSTTGRASFYCSTPEIDIIRTVGSDVDVLPDQAGSLRPENHTPLLCGMKADGTTDDGPALTNLFARILAKTRGVVDLPPGDILIGTAVTLASISGLRIRGAGRGITRLIISDGAVAPFTLSNCTDVAFEDLSIVRTSVGSTYLVSIASNCTRTAFRRTNLTRGYIGVIDAGTDTIYDDLAFDGADWVNGIRISAATRPSLTKIVARYGNSLGATDGFIDVGSGTSGLRARDLDIAPSDTSLFSGSALKISGVTDPTDCIFTTSRFSGGFTGSPRAAVIISDGAGLRFNSCTLTNSLNAFAVTNDVVDLTLSDCTQFGMRQHGITVTGDYQILTIQGLISSDVSQQTANTYSHVFLEPATQGLFTTIDTLAYGNMILGTATTARYVVNANQNVNFSSMSGVSGDYNMIGTSVFNLAAAIDGVAAVAHNIESSDPTRRHDAFAWPLYSTTTTTPGVTNRHCIRITSAITITNFTGGRDGQEIKVLNASGGTLTIADNANIQTIAAANITDANGGAYAFVYDGTSAIWREIG